LITSIFSRSQTNENDNLNSSGLSHCWTDVEVRFAPTIVTVELQSPKYPTCQAGALAVPDRDEGRLDLTCKRMTFRPRIWIVYLMRRERRNNAMRHAHCVDRSAGFEGEKTSRENSIWLYNFFLKPRLS
jgi:hypothetical protein